MFFAIACLAVVALGSRVNAAFIPNNSPENGQGQALPDFGQGQQQQMQGQIAFDPSTYAAMDPTIGQRLAGNNFYPIQQGAYPGQQSPGLQAQQQQQQAQGGEPQWSASNGEMADLSQVLMQNVVAQQVSQLQQGQPDPLATSPYHTLLKNLAGTAPNYPPVAPPGGVAVDSRFPGQIIAQGPAGEVVEKLDPPGPPHPPLRVDNANYLTAVASIPERIGPSGISGLSNHLQGAFPHQTYNPNISYMNRGQQAPPSFNPWPANLQSGGQQSQQSLQQGVQQQQNFALQYRNPPSYNQAQRHPSGQVVVGSSNFPRPQVVHLYGPATVDLSSTSREQTSIEQLKKSNKSEHELQEENLKNYLTKQIQELKIVSYGVSLCQACEETDKILRTYKSPVHSFQLDTMVMGNEIMEIIQKQTGSKDIPQVFICGHFIGGFRKVQELHKTEDIKNLIKRCNS